MLAIYDTSMKYFFTVNDDGHIEKYNKNIYDSYPQMIKGMIYYEGKFINDTTDGITNPLSGKKHHIYKYDSKNDYIGYSFSNCKLTFGLYDLKNETYVKKYETSSKYSVSNIITIRIYKPVNILSIYQTYSVDDEDIIESFDATTLIPTKRPEFL